jgi:two-component system, cell cycle response regulator
MATQASMNIAGQPVPALDSRLLTPPQESGAPLRLIVADDSPISRKLMQHALENLGLQLQVASDGVEAWELLQAQDVPTIAILDWMMPGVEGVELCRRIRQLSRQHYTYTVLLTSKSGKREIIEGLNAGADDYITKPFDKEEMHARMLVARRIIHFQEELFAAREIMRDQATHDHLTQLLNRGGIMEVLEQEMSRSRRSGQPFSLIIADIDHFKKINDTFGHLTGDHVLSEVAWRIKSSMRSYDSVGRYGGEEFLVLVPECDAATAFQVAEKIRNAVGYAPISLQQQQAAVTISLGVSTWKGEASSEELLLAADSALYRAKESGRNCARAGLPNGM